MMFRHRGRVPEIDPTAWVAPNAVVSGDVRIGPGTAVLYGAVLTGEGGAIRIGAECVVMEHAVLRATPRHRLSIGDGVLIGPGAHVTGCTVEDEAFLATGTAVFNGARVGRGSSVRIGAVVHVNTRLSAEAVVPIGWVAVGDPAQVFPPGAHDRIWPIQRLLDFPGTVFGVPRAQSRASIRRYARALTRHRDDIPFEPPERRDGPS